MEAIEFLKKNNLSNTKITMIKQHSWTEKIGEFCSLTIEGDCVKDDYRYFDMFFGRIIVNSPKLKGKIDGLNAMESSVLKDVSATKKDKNYDVKLVLENSGRESVLEFICGHFGVTGKKYRGFDYTNVYGTPKYLEMEEKCSYVFDERYFFEEDVTELPDGFSLYERGYMHKSDHAIHVHGTKCELRKGGKCIYTYRSYDNHRSPYKEFIIHSNGHRYYAFHVDLYGISYIDVDTLEVFNYIPRGYDNQYGMPYGESFIVNKVHYNPASNLVAYEGCYWADTSDVMIGKLDNPLSFDPHLISVNAIIDPEYEEGYDVDFGNWDMDGITVKMSVEEEKRTTKLSYADLKRVAETQNKDSY